MQLRKSGSALVVGSMVLLGLMAPSHASAARHRMASGHGYGHSGGRFASVRAFGRHHGWGRHVWRGYARLQCVPFARSDSGIELKGNANIWWNEAAGRYQRGSRPEPGSVLSFAANGRMRLGHVAVVSDVINAREIEIDHANWWGPGSRGGVTRGVPVVDVSPDNDWTEVRVALGNGDFGSVYRTHGFIYDRPDGGTMVANSTSSMPVLTRPAHGQTAFIGATGVQDLDGNGGNDEVAEAPDESGFRTTRWGGVRFGYRGWGHAAWRGRHAGGRLNHHHAHGDALIRGYGHGATHVFSHAGAARSGAHAAASAHTAHAARAGVHHRG